MTRGASLAGCLLSHSTGSAGVERGVDHRQSHIISHLSGYLIHVEVFGIDLLHVLDHLVGDAEEGGVDHIVLPQRHFTDMTFVEQRELFQELLESEQLAHFVEIVVEIEDASLGVEGLYERVGIALVIA